MRHTADDQHVHRGSWVDSTTGRRQRKVVRHCFPRPPRSMQDECASVDVGETRRKCTFDACSKCLHAVGKLNIWDASEARDELAGYNQGSDDLAARRSHRRHSLKFAAQSE